MSFLGKAKDVAKDVKKAEDIGKKVTDHKEKSEKSNSKEKNDKTKDPKK